MSQVSYLATYGISFLEQVCVVEVNVVIDFRAFKHRRGKSKRFAKVKNNSGLEGWEKNMGE